MCDIYISLYMIYILYYLCVYMCDIYLIRKLHIIEVNCLTRYYKFYLSFIEELGLMVKSISSDNTILDCSTLR